MSDNLVRAKRERSADFNAHETERLLEFVNRNKAILLSKEQKSSIVSEKSRLWKQIAEELSAPGCLRSVKTCRDKWQNLVTIARREGTDVIDEVESVKHHEVIIRVSGLVV